MRYSRAAVAVELAALVALAGLAWPVAAVATHAWLARVATLARVRPLAAAMVRSRSHTAALEFSAGAVLLASARALALRRCRDALVVPWILPAAVVACLIGLAVQLATVEVAHGAALAPTGARFAQGFLLGSIAGAVVLVAPADLGEVARRARWLVALAITAIFIGLAVAGTGPAGTGTHINLGPFQPIEVAKFLAIPFLAAVLGARAAKLRWQRRPVFGLRWPRPVLLVPAFAALVAIFGALYLVGDLGPVLLLALVFLGMFFLASRASGWVVGALALVALLLAVLGHWPGLAGHGTVQTRLRMWRAPWTNGLPGGDQVAEGLWAMAAGGPRGQGLAQAATPLVPAGKTDLILVTMVEQLGGAGLVAYELAIALIVLGGFSIAARNRTPERVLLAGGAALLLLAQWLVIQSGTLGQLPLTGIVVPFLSEGRSSMVVFLALVAMLAKLALDARPRERSVELDELHTAARRAAVASALLSALLIVSGLRACLLGRARTSARPIAVRLADGTLIHKQNPRLVAIAASIRRGTIADRHGAPLAESLHPGRRTYPLGSAFGTLLGVWPARVLLPPWALERALDHRLRGYGERSDAPPGRDVDRHAPSERRPSPDLRRFAPLLELRPAARSRAVAALDADVASRSVRLSLDAALQTRVARILSERRRGPAAAAVVIDVDTGQVLARAQVPDYDPGHPDWENHVLAGDAAYLRRFYGAYGAWPDKTGIQGVFQAGSVGKLFTALAAVRAGMADPIFACAQEDARGPFMTRPGWSRPIHDFAGDRPHGRIDLVQALAVSCNVYFAQLGLALGPAPLVALRHDGVRVGYRAPLEPGKAGSRQLASTAFGQGAMAMSPMQAARLVAAIAGGGVYRRCPPTMELDATCSSTRLVDNPARLAPILAGMRRVMTRGTGRHLHEPGGVRVYGKTGTADARGFLGEEPFGISPGAAAPPHSWFVAFAEPTTAREGAVTAPGRLAVAVVVPRGGTGAAMAGPLAMEIFAAARSLGYLAPAP